MTQLSDYVVEVQELVRDSNNQFTSLPAMKRYINRARVETAKRSACLQALVTGQSAFGTSSQPGYAIPGAMVPGALPDSNPDNENEPGADATASNGFVTISGVELYSYQYAKPFLQKQYQGYNSVIYVSSVAVSWGGQKPMLNWMPWDDLQAYCRAVNLGVSSYPFVWSQKGVGENGQIWLYPIPTNLASGTMDWECICTPLPLYSDSDYEALPEIYQNCVSYYAAYKCFMSQQRTGMAQIMLGQFEEKLQINGVASDWGHITSYYTTAP